MRILDRYDLIPWGTAGEARRVSFPGTPPPVALLAHDVDDGPPAVSLETMRVLVVADDALARAGLVAILAELPDCRIVGQMTGDAELAQAFERLDPDAVVWDAGRLPALPDLTGLGEGAPPILLLSSGEPQALRGLAGRVRGLLPRDADAAALSAALRAITRGLIVTDPEWVGALQRSRDRAEVALPEPLTPREVGVLQLLAAGLPNKLIAERLGISEHTVRFHLNAIFGKLDAHTRTEAVTRAARLGVIVL